MEELERLKFNMRVQQDKMYEHASKEHEEMQKNQ